MECDFNGAEDIAFSNYYCPSSVKVLDACQAYTDPYLEVMNPVASSPQHSQDYLLYLRKNYNLLENPYAKCDDYWGRGFSDAGLYVEYNYDDNAAFRDLASENAVEGTPEHNSPYSDDSIGKQHFTYHPCKSKTSR